MAEPRESGISFGGVLFSDLYFKLNIQYSEFSLFYLEMYVYNDFT